MSWKLLVDKKNSSCVAEFVLELIVIFHDENCWKTLKKRWDTVVARKNELESESIVLFIVFYLYLSFKYSLFSKIDHFSTVQFTWVAL